jgi:hypothetical protein
MIVVRQNIINTCGYVHMEIVGPRKDLHKYSCIIHVDEQNINKHS